MWYERQSRGARPFCLENACRNRCRKGRRRLSLGPFLNHTGFLSRSGEKLALLREDCAKRLRQLMRIPGKDGIADKAACLEIRVGEISDELLRILPFDAQGRFGCGLDRAGIGDLEEDHIVAQLL